MWADFFKIKSHQIISGEGRVEREEIKKITPAQTMVGPQRMTFF